jgi:hypothetical protein
MRPPFGAALGGQVVPEAALSTMPGIGHFPNLEGFFAAAEALFEAGGENQPLGEVV